MSCRLLTRPACAHAAVAPGDELPPNVEHLILTDNALTHISASAFARLTRVRKLMLANNKLAALPGSGVKFMSQLQLVRLANNRLQTLPRELLRLPKLAWLAVSGNPLCPAAPRQAVPRSRRRS